MTAKKKNPNAKLFVVHLHKKKAVKKPFEVYSTMPALLDTYPRMDGVKITYQVINQKGVFENDDYRIERMPINRKIK